VNIATLFIICVTLIQQENLNFVIQNKIRKMKKVINTSDFDIRISDSNFQNSFPGYPIYAASEDIYSMYKNENELYPEDIYRIKEANYIYGADTENDLNNQAFDLDLNLPGSEFNSIPDYIVSEGEENNYYYQLM